MPDFKELVQNLYASKNRELTSDKFDYIQKTYTGKEQDFVKNFYATIGEDLTKEKLDYINTTYLKTSTEEQPKLEKGKVFSTLFGDSRPERQMSESTSVSKIATKERLETEVKQAPERERKKQEKIKLTKETALKNTIKQNLENNKIPYTEGDLNWKNAESKIQKSIGEDQLGLTYDKLGNPYYVKSLNGFESLWQGFKQSATDEKDSFVFWNHSIEDKVKFADDAIQNNTIPEGVVTGRLGKAAEFVGSSAEDLAKGFGGGFVGAEVGGSVAGVPGAIFGGAGGAFLAMAPSAYTKAYTGETIKRYKQSIDEIKSQGREVTKQDKIDAMSKALPQGQTAGGVELVKIAVLSFVPGGKGASGKGFINLLKQDIKHTAVDVVKFSGLSAGGSLATDVSAKARGYNVRLSEMVTNALEKGGEGATTAAAFGSVHGLFNVSKYTRAGALDYLSTIERPKLVSYSMAQEANGIIPKGATEKMITELDSFKQAQDKVPGFVPDVNKASFAGNIRKKMNLEEQKRSSDPSFHPKIDEQISAIDDRIKRMTESPDPTQLEVDDVTGATGEPIAQTEQHVQDSIKNLEPEETKTPEQLKDVESTTKSLEEVAKTNPDIIDVEGIKKEISDIEKQISDLNSKDETVPEELQTKLDNLNNVEHEFSDYEQVENEEGIMEYKEKKLTPKEIAEKYHAAKEDGTNPEFVNAVEKVLAPKEVKPTEVLDVDGAKEFNYIKQYLPDLFKNINNKGQLEDVITFVKENIRKDKKLTNTKELEEAAVMWLNKTKYSEKFKEVKPTEATETTKTPEEHEFDAHTEALNETVKNTEYEEQARSAGLREEPSPEPTGEVPGKPERKPIEEANAPNETRATWEDAGFKSEQESRESYARERDGRAKESYEEYLFKKHCGEG